MGAVVKVFPTKRVAISPAKLGGIFGASTQKSIFQAAARLIIAVLALLILQFQSCQYLAASIAVAALSVSPFQRCQYRYCRAANIAVLALLIELFQRCQ